MKRRPTAALLCAALLAAGLGAALPPAAAQDAAPRAADVIKRDFHPRGIATMDRLGQDAPALVCTKFNDNPPAELAKKLEADQFAKIAFPADGKLMGDWKRGQRISQSGRGMTWSDAPGTENGGSCYNCHQLSGEELSFGTLGPSLFQFGKKRGFTEANQKYVYGKIYNAKAYNLCTNMPRLGHTGTLTEQQMKDLTAYLMDPASPVNK
jgi:sulfur-oxidizing protein SoxX